VIKYSGAGNTFLIFTDSYELKEQPKQIERICTKTSCDGLIFLEAAPHADCRMRIFNADGYEAQMCGNGLRCVARYLWDHQEKKPEYLIKSERGDHRVWASPETICCALPDAEVKEWEFSLDLFEGHKGYLVDTSVLHLVLFFQPTDVEKVGRSICHHPHFAPHGVNVNFVTVDKECLHVRTYERGVERETLACGTGSVASALTAAHLFDLPSPMMVKVRSNARLKITFNRWKQIFLEGPAHQLVNKEKIG